MLTSTQESLITALTTEFENLNDRENKTLTEDRFSLKTVLDCDKEEKAFLDSINTYNKGVIPHYKDTFIEEVNEFLAEFSTVISVQYGHSRYGNLINTIETWVESNNEDDKFFSNSNEVNLFLVSNKNKAKGEDEMYCRGNAFTVVYVDFKRERQELTLKSGKTIASTRIVGLQYNLNNWLHRDKGFPYKSLDELIQNSKQMQQRIVALSV